MKRLICLMAMTALTSPAYAQDITVTARKFEENIQTTPVSITRFDQEQLDARGARTVSDIPGIGEKAIIMSGDALLMSMRGQTQNIIDITTDSSVATYVDGIYVARGYGLNTTLLDVNNVQVLYGPQGTLFGRNSTGGAVLFETNDPVLNKFGVTATADYNSDDEPAASLVLNSPLGQDLALRLAGRYEDESNWVTDRITGKKYGEKNTVHGRAKLRYAPGSLDAVISGEYYRSRGANEARFMDYGFGQNAALATMNPGDTVAINAPTFNRTELYSVSTRVKYEDFKLVAGYRRVKSNHLGDWDGTPSDLYSQVIDADVEQFNAEANYFGNFGPVKYNVGAFYFQENGSELGEARFYGGLQHSRFVANIDNKSYGVYLANYIDLTNRLRLNASVRYTHDDKDAITRNVALRNGQPLACVGNGLLSAGCASPQSASFDKVTWSAGLDYFINPQTMTYVKVGTGYKSGGNQNRALINEGVQFKPENIFEVEAGVKGEVGPVRYSLAGFYNEVDNYQILTVFRTPIVHTLIVNAAKTRNYGAELNTSIALQDNFIITGSAQFVNPKFVDYVRNGVDVSNSRFNNVSKYQFTVDGRYTLRNVTANVSYTWRDSTPQASQSAQYLIATYGAANAEKILDVTTIKAHGILNASLRADFGPISVTAYGNNLTNTRYKKSNSFNEGLWNTSAFNEDRSYGVRLGYKF